MARLGIRVGTMKRLAFTCVFTLVLVKGSAIAAPPLQLQASLSAAQENDLTPESRGVIDLPVTALICAEAPSSEGLGQFYTSGALPTGCDPAPGVGIIVEENGDLVPGGPFTTDADGRVLVHLASGSVATVTEDSGTVPREYEPLTQEVNGVAYANPVRLDPVTEGYQWGLIFVNVPSTARPTAEPRPADMEAASVEDVNTETVRALYEQVYSQGSLELIDELYAPDYVEHQANFPPGLEGVRRVVVALRTGFPDLEVAIEDITAQADKVWVLATMLGTHQGEIFGVPATGRVIEVRWFDVYQLADGKIVAHWGVGDELGLMQQLGFELVLPTPTASGP
jgi:steroid delta-isomerase-like uncharacterized protein